MHIFITNDLNQSCCYLPVRSTAEWYQIHFNLSTFSLAAAVVLRANCHQQALFQSHASLLLQSAMWSQQTPERSVPPAVSC